MRMREKTPLEFYKTPYPCIEIIRDIVKNGWECCAGDGRFKDVLGERIVAMSDIIGRRNDVIELDFLKQSKAPLGVGMIVTNPPFSLAGNMIRHAIFDLKIPALFLIRIEWLSTMKNADIQKHLKEIRIVSNLVKFETENGRIVNGNGTGRVGWCLFVPEPVLESKIRFSFYCSSLQVKE